MRDAERLTTWVLRSDKQALRRMAASQGETMSVVLRQLIRAALGRHEAAAALTQACRGQGPLAEGEMSSDYGDDQ
jgi:hypothetical protein